VQTNWIDAKRVSSHCPGPASYSTRGALQIPLSSHTPERIQSIRNHSPNWKSREAVRALHTAARRLQASWNPNSSNVKANDHLPERLTDEQRAYKHLRPVIDSLPGPIDWAVAYGSGVRHQANSDPSGVNPTTTFLPSRIAEQQKPPMTDFLLSTPSLPEFHSANLRRNPSHYPLTARLLGGRRIAWLTERWGAGLWYVTMVNIRGLVSVFISELSGGGLGLIREEVKYGVISTEKLKKDLQGWDTLYVAGRLHKPVCPSLSLTQYSAV
jgi:translocator assembly and maintenance protein 41